MTKNQLLYLNNSNSVVYLTLKMHKNVFV